MENTFILALEATVLQILEVWDTLCIAESENEEESNYDGSKRRYQSDRLMDKVDRRRRRPPDRPPFAVFQSLSVRPSPQASNSLKPDSWPEIVFKECVYIKVLIEKRLISIKMELTITQPDDWHLHLRDGSLLQAVLPHSAKQFGRAIVMPNLKPPITTTSAAVAYRESILKAIPKDSNFNPLMTLYLTDMTTPDEIKLAKVTNSSIDIFDREKVFIETILEPLVQRLPQLKVVMEHITTADAVKFVESCKEGYVAATVTPQHLLLNRNALFQSGLQPHNYCLPVLKREIHRQAIVSAVTSGSKRFFLGTDSAPHDRRNKECSCGCAGIYNSPVALSLYAKVFEEAGALDKLEAFTSFNGPDFYGLPRNKLKIRLRKAPWKVPDYLSFPFGDIVPMFAGETLEWEALPC
ncbi:Dihydroorotase, mitochondrial [Glycine soja]